MNRDDIIRMAREAGINVTEGNSFSDDMYISVLYRFANIVAAAEREECLEACRMYFNLNDSPEGFQNGVECCIAVITHKSDPDVMARIKARGHKL